jgi:hypothetical protein
LLINFTLRFLALEAIHPNRLQKSTRVEQFQRLCLTDNATNI